RRSDGGTDGGDHFAVSDDVKREGHTIGDERLREERTKTDERLREEQTKTDHGAGDADHLQRLWTPHRMTYIADSIKTGSNESSEPFTDIPNMSDEDGLVV